MVVVVVVADWLSATGVRRQRNEGTEKRRRDGNTDADCGRVYIAVPI